MRCFSYYSLLPTRGHILLLLSLLFVTSFASLTLVTRGIKCNDNSTYTDGSRYFINLDTVLNYLIQNGSQSGFSNSSYGQSPNKVYGFIQCIGKISAQDCSKCSEKARYSLETYCPKDIGGQVWMTYCYLRYDNSSFVSKLDTDGAHSAYNVNEVSNDVEAFKSAKMDLLFDLSKTASNLTSRGFAIGSTNYSASGNVYGLVQCWRDISINDCNKCLTSAIQELESCCSTKPGAQAMFGSCTVRYENYSFYEPAESVSSPAPSPWPERSLPAPSFSPKFSTADSPVNGTLQLSKPNKRSSKIVPIILGTLGGLVLLVVVCMSLLRKKLKYANLGEPVTAVTHGKEIHEYSEMRLLSEEHIYLFTLETLIEATQHFHPDNKLGEGGFGVVYKVTARNGKNIAVKKLSAKSSQGKNEFMNEVNVVASIQHRNLVKLLGCCVEGDERLLVYEYLQNKSLDNFLFDPEKLKHLNWEKLYNIILGIARGLLYLHEDSQLRIIHRDIKANNILLDDKLNPKIGDFGLARLFPQDATHIRTRVAGTYGYMAPEYAMRGQLSIKADVYSFGVLLLEIVSGRRNIEDHLPQEMQNLLEWTWRLYKRGDALKIVDSIVIENCPQEQAQRCIHVGLLCVQADASLRPTMSNVLMMISNNLVALPNVAKLAFVSSRSPSPGSRTTTPPPERLPSVNDTSVSELKPR